MIRCRMGRFAVATLLALLGLALAPVAAGASTLDQQQTTMSGTESVYGHSAPGGLAQTFTAGLSGTLEQVDLAVYGSAPDGEGLIVEVRNVEPTGVPGMTLLATALVPNSDAQRPLDSTFLTVDFSTPAAVEAGIRYALVLYPSSPGGSYQWLGSAEESYGGPDAYTGGWAFSSASSPRDWSSSWSTLQEPADFAFKTYVLDVADVSVTMTAPTAAATRSQMTYGVAIDNAGPHTARNLVLTVQLPYGTQYEGASSPQGSCTPPGRRITTVICNLGNIAKDSSAEAGVHVQIKARPGQGFLTAVATVTSDSLDPDTSDNSATATTAVTR